ncbi:unnamed protein product [Amoebophrya sp. A120]|nr:unnamed protein product [Amoebophrya sp. A120]|eukprot:GSA120T00010989001.1
MQGNKMLEEAVKQVANRVRGALWGMYMGDALAMPVHWYYDRNRLRRDFGQITKYEKSVPEFPGSIMNLSNTGGGGRGSDQGSIIGDVILHGKKKYWTRGGSYHYHHGMEAGDNTLDTILARLLVKTMADNKELITQEQRPTKLVDAYLELYVKFMTTPDSHKDVYAATAHRMFFANWIKKLPLRECADNDGHNTDSIDGMINVIPFTLVRVLAKPDADRNLWITDIINALRNSDELPQWGRLYDEVLGRVLLGEKLRPAIEKVAAMISPQLPRMLQKSVGTAADADPMTACYIHSSFPAMLVFAYKYADNPKAALLASANAGGENVNRSAILGALMGAAHGPDFDLSLKQGLVHAKEYETEIEQFVSTFSRGGPAAKTAQARSEL